MLVMFYIVDVFYVVDMHQDDDIQFYSTLFNMCYLLQITFSYEIDEDMEFLFFCAQTVALICVLGYYYSFGHRERVYNSILTGDSFVDELLIGLERNFFDLLRVSKGCYVNLSNELRQKGLLFDSRNVTVEEQVPIFLFTIAHNERNQVMQIRFQHSGETISRYFNKVLGAIMRLCPHYIKAVEVRLQ